MLAPYFRTLEAAHAEDEVAYQRSLALRNKLEKYFPLTIDAQLSIDNFGMNCIRAFIYLPKDAPEDHTHMAVASIVRNFGGTMERELREDSGTFFWKRNMDNRSAIDDKGEYEELIFIENAHPGQCVVTKKEVVKTVYEAKCP